MGIAFKDETFRDDEEPVALERPDLVREERFDHLRARPCLIGVVERDADDRRGDPLLVAVELPDLDLGAELRVADVHSTQRDVFLQHRRARAARDNPDLLSADVHAVAVPAGLVSLQLEPDQHALRMRPAFGESFAPDEVVLLVGRDREADPGLERIGLIVELVAGEDQPGLDP